MAQIRRRSFDGSLKINENLTIRVIDNLLYEHQYMKEVDFLNIDVRDDKNMKPQLTGQILLFGWQPLLEMELVKLTEKQQ